MSKIAKLIIFTIFSLATSVFIFDNKEKMGVLTKTIMHRLEIRKHREANHGFITIS